MAPNRTKIHGNLIKKLYDKVAGCIVCLWDASYSTVLGLFSGSKKGTWIHLFNFFLSNPLTT